MKTAAGLFLLCVAPVLALRGVAAPVSSASALTKAPIAASPTLPTVSDIVQKEGRFVFSDGSSYYLFRKDGTFKSGPLGLSGRTIDGTWKFGDPLLNIEGNWGWINGISALNDTRKMRLFVHPTKTFKTAPFVRWISEKGAIKIYDCYFGIEELVKIPQPPTAAASK
jgi:hypothetical protein